MIRRKGDGTFLLFWFEVQPKQNRTMKLISLSKTNVTMTLLYTPCQNKMLSVSCFSAKNRLKPASHFPAVVIIESFW